MNILFVYPAKLDNDSKPIKYRLAFLPPLSIAILNRLTPNQHSTKIVNDFVENIDYTTAFDLVCITAMTTQIERAYQVADNFRNKGIKVIIGGMHATILPEEVKQHADSVVVGEVEDLWEQILDDLENKNLKKFYKKEHPDISRLIIPKWDNFNMKIYPKRIGSKFPMLPIFATRGCPYGCKFCSVTKFYGKAYRTKPISNILKEIETIGARDYFLIDDNIAHNANYSRELFKALAKKNINWFSQVSTKVLRNPDLIDLAAASGCFSWFIGVESINPKSLSSVDKGFNKIEEYEEMIARMHKAGINPFLSFMLGFDDDIIEQFHQTLEFIKKNKVVFATFFILTPLPGTDLYDELHKEGRIVDFNWSKYDVNNVVYQPKNFSKKQLEEIYWKIYQSHYTLKNSIINIGNLFSVSQKSRKPVHQFLNNLFYHLCYIYKIRFEKDHIFSGGIKKRL